VQGAYKPGQISVITPYGEQLRLLQQEAAKFTTAVVNERDDDDYGNITDKGVRLSKHVDTCLCPATINRSAFI
jgi:hypothetical protein